VIASGASLPRGKSRVHADAPRVSDVRHHNILQVLYRRQRHLEPIGVLCCRGRDKVLRPIFQLDLIDRRSLNRRLYSKDSPSRRTCRRSRPALGDASTPFISPGKKTPNIANTYLTQPLRPAR
jgi:hypothetical protein